MRQIKFRVWDKKDNLWLAGWNIGQSGITSEYGNKVIMQFTGLTDKNGKEIYEGDILGAYGVIKKYEVRWYDLGAGWRVGTDDKDTFFNGIGVYAQSEFEVIGNIYENPELLEK